MAKEDSCLVFSEQDKEIANKESKSKTRYSLYYGSDGEDTGDEEKLNMRIDEKTREKWWLERGPQLIYDRRPAEQARLEREQKYSLASLIYKKLVLPPSPPLPPLVSEFDDDDDDFEQDIRSLDEYVKQQWNLHQHEAAAF